MAENTPQYRVFRLPLTPYVVWNREHPGLDQPSDERQYPSYPAHAPGNVMMRFCIRDRKWKPKSDFPQDPARPGQILRSKRGEPIKFCTRCADYFDQRALAKKKKKKPAVRKPADLSELRKKLQVADAAAGLLNRRLEQNRQQRQRLNRQAGENSEMRRLLLANIARLEGEGDPPKEEDDDKQVAGGGRDNHNAGEHMGLSNIHASGGYHTRQETNDDYFSAPLAIAAPALIRQNTYSDAPNHTYPPPPTNDQADPYASAYDSYPAEPFGDSSPDQQQPTVLSFEHGTYRPMTPPLRRSPRFSSPNRQPAPDSSLAQPRPYAPV